MTSTSTTIKTTRKRSSMLPGGVFVQHTPFGSNRTSMGGGGTTIVRRSNVLSQSTAPMMPLGEASKVSRETVESVKGLRGKEKKTMNDLNGRLADYLEKVRCLEMTNKALYQQLEQLRKVKGITGDDVRAEFEEELEEARNALKEASQQLSPLQANKLELEDKIDTLEAMIEDLKKDRQDLLNKIDKLNQMLGEIEGENASLKRSIENVMTEKDMWKKDNNTLRDDNARIRGDLETARTRQIDAQNELEALAEELQFEKDISAKEIAELKAYIEQMKDFTPKMENMYKSGMKEVMQELQDHYNNQLEEMRNELERRCEERILSMQQNLRRDNTDSAISKTENKQLKIENKDLKDRLHDLERENDRLNALIRQLKEEKDKSDAEHDEEMFKMQSRLQELAAELDRVHSDLNELKDSKMDLELEIQCYRKLLDCEENSIKTALADSVNMQSQGGANLASIIAGGPASQSSQQSSS